MRLFVSIGTFDQGLIRQSALDPFEVQSNRRELDENITINPATLLRFSVTSGNYDGLR